MDKKSSYGLWVTIPPLIAGNKCNPKCRLYVLNSLYIPSCALGLADNRPIGELFPGKRCPRYGKSNR